MSLPTNKTERVAIFPQGFTAPEPEKSRPKWKCALEGFFGEKPDEQWGGRLIRSASDMMVVCDGDLNILFHNRAFLRGAGHDEGSYLGHSFLDFIPACDKADASRVFDQFLGGRVAGMRIEAAFLTRTGRRNVEARVTRTLRSQGRFFLYFVIREVEERAVEKIEQKPVGNVNSIFEGLPIAAFRTDHQLRIVDVFGSYWETLGLDTKNIMGVELTNSKCPVAPEFFHQIDYCDVMAGQTYHAGLNWRDHDVEITIEPFIDRTKGGRVIGALGTLRESKNAASSGANHLKFPRPEEYTQRQSIAKARTRPVSLVANENRTANGPAKNPVPKAAPEKRVAKEEQPIVRTGRLKPMSESATNAAPEKPAAEEDTLLVRSARLDPITESVFAPGAKKNEAKEESSMVRSAKLDPVPESAITTDVAKIRTTIRPRPLRPAKKDEKSDGVALAN